MNVKEYLYKVDVMRFTEGPDRNGHIWNKKAVEKAVKKYNRQQKLRKIKDWFVIFIVAAVFLLFCYGVFGLIVDVLPQIVK